MRKEKQKKEATVIYFNKFATEHKQRLKEPPTLKKKQKLFEFKLVA